MSYKSTSRIPFTLYDVIGLGTILLVFVLSMIMVGNADAAILSNRPLIVACFIGYTLCFIGGSNGFYGRISEQWQRLLFAAQLLFAFAILWMLPLDFLPILTIIWASVSLKYFKPGTAIAITTIVVAAWFSIYAIVWEQRSAIYSAMLYFTFHLFALMMSITAKRAEQATAEAKALNTELQATRELLAESTKVQERTRIARELHDLLGHHLTALNINLQVASHQLSANKEPALIKESVDQSYFLAKLLMSDVREAVSTIRDNQQVDISKAIELIEAAFPNLNIKLSGDPIPSENIELLHDLIRCIQEVVTNAVKHGHANEVSIHCQHDDLKTEVSLIDNGHGLKQQPIFGNGLNGMKERLASHNGELRIEAEDGRLKVEITLPNANPNNKSVNKKSQAMSTDGNISQLQIGSVNS